MAASSYQRLQPHLRRDLSPDAKAGLVNSVRWLQDLDYNLAKMLAPYVEVYRLPAGYEVFDEGENEAYLAMVLAGGVRITKKDADDEARVIAEVSAGQTFGEVSLIDAAPRSGSARTSAAAELMILTRGRFEMLTRERPELGVALLWRISRLLAQRLRKTTGRLVEHLER